MNFDSFRSGDHGDDDHDEDKFRWTLFAFPGMISKEDDA